MKYQVRTGVLVPFMQKHYKLLILAIASLFTLLYLMMTLTAKAAVDPNWEIKPSSTLSFTCGGTYVHTLDTVTQNSDGTFSGSGYYNANGSYTWNIDGEVYGDMFNFTLVYTGTNSGYTLHATNGMIDSDGSAVATVDGNCQSVSIAAGSFNDILPPPTPTNLWRVVAADTSQTLACGDVTARQILYPTWEAYTESDFSHYEYNSFNNGTPGIVERRLSTNQLVHSWTPPVDGTFGFQVRTVDLAGNNSEWSPICEITYDSIEPVVTITNPFSGDELSRVVYVEGEIVDEHNARHRLLVRDSENNVVYSEIVRNTDEPAYASIMLDTTMFEDGEYRFVLVGIDEAGNRGRDSVLVTINNYVRNKDECKDGGWTMGLDGDDNAFRNQGDCVSYFATNMRNPATAGAKDERANNKKDR